MKPQPASRTEHAIGIRANPWHDVEPMPDASGKVFNAIIEIPLGSTNKYEIDKGSGLLKLDRVLHSAVHYPANYGFIPRTMASDGDPLDVLVLASEPIHPLTIVTARPIGLLTMTDANEDDHKVIAVPLMDPDYNEVRKVQDLPPHQIAVIKRFFEDYKALEKKKVIVDSVRPVADAWKIIKASLEAYQTWTAGKTR